jgi:hypothetical protein
MRTFILIDTSKIGSLILIAVCAVGGLGADSARNQVGF